MSTPEILWPATRQYRHNNSDEFVMGYDTIEVEKIVKQLQAELEQLKKYHAGGRANLIETDEGLSVCFGNHDKNESCDFIAFYDEKMKNHTEQLQTENVMLREALDNILNLHVEGREFMTNSQLYEAVIQDCTKALNHTPQIAKSQAVLDAAISTARIIEQELSEKNQVSVDDDYINEDYHQEITITVGEAKQIILAVREYKEE